MTTLSNHDWTDVIFVSGFVDEKKMKSFNLEKKTSKSSIISS
jgi:hypothetical protein